MPSDQSQEGPSGPGEKVGSIRKSVEVQASAEKVFEYIDDANKRGGHMLGMGRSFRPELLTKNATGLGATYRWQGTMYGVGFGWTEVVTKWVKNREKATHSIEGMKIDVTWTLTPGAHDWTILTFSMDYSLGYSLLGKLLDWLWAERYCSEGIDSDFHQMKDALEGHPGRTGMDEREEETRAA